MVFIVFYNLIEFMILLYTFLVTSFGKYREYMLCLISFRFLEVSPVFIYAKAAGNL